jgi:hypothetical protein
MVYRDCFTNYVFLNDQPRDINEYPEKYRTKCAISNKTTFMTIYRHREALEIDIPYYSDIELDIELASVWYPPPPPIEITWMSPTQQWTEISQ